MRALVEDVKAGYTVYDKGDVFLIVDVQKVINNYHLMTATGSVIPLPKGTEVICLEPEQRKGFLSRMSKLFN